MMSNTNPLPHTSRTYSYLGARCNITWIHRWACADYYLVDLKYEGTDEVAYLVRWDTELFTEVQ